MSTRTHSPWLAVALLAASSLTVMAGATIAPSLPSLNAHFAEVPHATLLTKLVLTLPAFFIAVLAPFMGAAADRLGRKPLLVASTVLYGLAGASGYFVDWLPGILLGRALLGVAVAGIMTSSMALIADYFEGRARHRFMGLQASMAGFGGVVFLTAGGMLASIGWRLPFLIYLAALALLPLMLLALHEPARSREAPDRVKGGGVPWSSLALIYCSTCLTMIIFYLVPVQVPFLLQAMLDASPTQSGMAIASGTLAFALTSPLFARLRTRVSDLGLWGVSMAVASVGLGIVATASTYWQVVVGLAILGGGMGLNMPNVSAWLMAVSPPHLRGRLAGGLTTSLFLGQFLSPLASEPLGKVIGLPATFGVAGVFVGAIAVIIGIVEVLEHRRGLAAGPAA